MKLASPIVAAARWFIVPLAGAVTLASACSAASVPQPEARPVPQLSRRTAAPATPTRGVSRAKDAARSSAAAAPGRASAGVVVGIDPETGQVGGLDAAQMARLSAAMRAGQASAPQRSAPIHHADGRVSMYVGNWMREYSVVRLGADGRPVFGCVDSRDAAVRLAHTKPATPGPEER